MTFDERIQAAKERDALPLPVPPAMKVCQGPCGLCCELDKAKNFFDTDRKAADKLKPLCRECRAQQRALKKLALSNTRQSRIDNVIEKMLKRARFGGSDVAHIAEVYAKICALMGGANGLAMAAVETYLRAPAGSPVRQKMISQFLNLSVDVTTSGAARVPNELLPEDELDARIKSMAIESRVVKMHDPDADEDADLRDSTEGVADA